MKRTRAQTRWADTSFCNRRQLSLWILGVFFFVGAGGCAHYSVNKPVQQCNPQAGYRSKNFINPEKDDQLLVLLTFSGGGTRAAAFSYGVLETLRDTQVSIRGRKQRLLDQVDWISGVSGGSFTAAYYGLYGDRIFEDFEARFLKKDIQRALIVQMFLNPVNWVKLMSPYYDRSDVAAAYYDTHVFDKKTFADILARKGPMVVINATDMVHGTRFSFIQDVFDPICSDLSSFSVARACAASSAVPVVLSPITLRNYAGKCGYQIPPMLAQALEPPKDLPSRRFELANNMTPFLDSKKKPYIHLIDGGVADNLGLRALLERITLFGSPWTAMKYADLEHVHKVAIVVVNAAGGIDTKWDRTSEVPTFAAMLNSYSSIAIERYNMETVALLQESLPRWVDEIRKGRCGEGKISTEPGSCGDIKFYLVEVSFDALDDKAERNRCKKLPTSFSLKPEQVNELRNAAHHILEKSRDYQRLIRDLQ